MSFESHVNPSPSVHQSIPSFAAADASPALIALADTVTEMVKRKHAFDEGVTALAGVDF